MLEIYDLTNLNYSIFFILLGIMVYYFGRFIGDTRVEEFDKDCYYIEGFFFFIFYVVIPFVIAIYADNYLENQESLSAYRVKLNQYSLGIILLQIFVLSCISKNIKANELFNRYGLLNKHKEDVKRKCKDISEGSGIDIEQLCESGYKKEPSELFEIIHYKIPIKVFGNKKVLYICSFITIYSSIYIYKNIGSPLIILISLLFTLFIITTISISIGYNGAYYPTAKIFIDDGTVFEGKILKFGKYIYLIKDEKKIFINKDRINYVEESLFKENGIK